MPKCCVKGCGSKYNKKASLISLHKLPKNEKLRRKWLESMGEENIDFSQKKTFVCSLHFEESCINRTLDLVRLQDNAIPTRLPKNYLKQRRTGLSATTSDVISIQEDYIKMVNQEQFNKTSASTVAGKNDVGDICRTIPVQVISIQPGMSKMTNPDFKMLQKLKNKCALQQKIIKRLNAKCSRQAKKLAHFENIIRDLKKEFYKK